MRIKGDRSLALKRKHATVFGFSPGGSGKMLASVGYIALWIIPGGLIGGLIAKVRRSSVFGGVLIGAALAPLGWWVIARSESLKAVGRDGPKPSNAALIAGLNVAIVALGMVIGAIVAVYLDHTQPGEGRVRPSEVQRLHDAPLTLHD